MISTYNTNTYTRTNISISCSHTQKLIHALYEIHHYGIRSLTTKDNNGNAMNSTHNTQHTAHTTQRTTITKRNQRYNQESTKQNNVTLIVVACTLMFTCFCLKAYTLLVVNIITHRERESMYESINS